MGEKTDFAVFMASFAFDNSAHLSKFVDFAKSKNAATCHVFSINE